MSNALQTPPENDALSQSNWFSVGLNRLRLKMGASSRQFAIFGLLLLVAGTLWARPAAVLLWHRLRIITGMPRMALADEDPEEIVKAHVIAPERLDVGRPVYLDDTLQRDPFKKRGDRSVTRSSTTSESVNPSVARKATERAERITTAASKIRLSGTAKGLGTALLNGRARQIGQGFVVGEFTFRLLEVRTGVVVLEGVFPDEEQVYQFRLDRDGAEPLVSE